MQPGGYSIKLIREKLEKDYGLTWSQGYLGQLLSNPFYHGVMTVNNTQYPHRYAPIISKSIFDQVQQIKASFNKKPFKYAGKPYIYRGLIRCGDCGLSITPEQHKGFVYYHCTQYNGKHGAKWFREEAITAQLEQVFRKIQLPEDVLEHIADNLNTLHQDKIKFHNMTFETLTREHKTTTKMLDNLYLDKLKGRITEDEYDKFYTSLREKITDVSIRLEQLQEAEDNYYITAK